MLSLVRRLFSRSLSSKDIAKSRLQMVLMDDRGISQDILNKIQKDISEILHKYIDFSPMTISFKSATVLSDTGVRVQPVLTAKIPVSGFKRYI